MPPPQGAVPQGRPWSPAIVRACVDVHVLMDLAAVTADVQLQRALITCGAWVQKSLANNSTLAPDLALELSGAEDRFVLRALAANTNLRSDAVTALARGRDIGVHFVLSSNFALRRADVSDLDAWLVDDVVSGVVGIAILRERTQGLGLDPEEAFILAQSWRGTFAELVTVLTELGPDTLVAPAGTAGTLAR